MQLRLPLASLLSQTLVAYTIEFDNEAEHRMPHRTTAHGAAPASGPAPWLVSLAMWANSMRHLPPEGLSLRELECLARTPTNLAGMQRWRYVTFAPDPDNPRPKPPRSTWIVRPTPAGRMAQLIWEPLAAEIESRWQSRFGPETFLRLKTSLAALDAQLDPGLPECLPILKFGLFCHPPNPKLPPVGPPSDPISRPLFALLSRLLLAFALEFEAGFAPSLAISANLLRVLSESGVRVRDLPALSGVSKESLQMAMGILLKRRLAAVEKNLDGSPYKIARLTPKGTAARSAYLLRVASLEADWTNRFGPARIDDLRSVLDSIASESQSSPSPLFKALSPYPECWRASVPRPSVLPHFPMVLHRGGYPDGS